MDAGFSAFPLVPERAFPGQGAHRDLVPRMSRRLIRAGPRLATLGKHD